MPLRFQQRIKLFPGLTLNLSKDGASLSAGFRGLHTTFGRRRQTTAGIPGSGLSYTWFHGRQRGTAPGSIAGAFVALFKLAIGLAALWFVISLMIRGG